jgi:GTP-binding protein
MIIQSARFISSKPSISGCPKSELPEFAFIGRSNVGKSSLINLLTGKKGLAKTSQTPGKTQLINHFLIDESWYIVDLPGYGFAKVPLAVKNQFKDINRDYILKRENLACLFVLIDSRLSPQTIDLQFIQWLGEHQIPFSLVFTKSDKIGTGTLSKNIENFTNKMLESWEALPSCFVTSSTKNEGKEALLDYIAQIIKKQE